MELDQKLRVGCYNVLAMRDDSLVRKAIIEPANASQPVKAQVVCDNIGSKPGMSILSISLTQTSSEFRHVLII